MIDMKIALVVHRFPTHSETFVIRQALNLLKVFPDLTIITLGGPPDWTQAAKEVHAVFGGKVATAGHYGTSRAATLRRAAGFPLRAALTPSGRRMLKAVASAMLAGNVPAAK